MQILDSETLSKDIDGFWENDTQKIVEYFPEKRLPVTLTTTENPELHNLLDSIDDKSTLALDFEWLPDRYGVFHPISLIQIGSSLGALIIRVKTGGNYDKIKNFMLTHNFIGKGTYSDRIKIKDLLGIELPYEDVEATRLRPYKKTVNFVEMVNTFYQEPTAMFKSKDISTSNWEAETLTIKQVLYAGFDVIGLWFAFQHMDPPKYTSKSMKRGERKAKRGITTKPAKTKTEKDPSKETKTERGEFVDHGNWCLCISNMDDDVPDSEILALITNGKTYTIQRDGTKWNKPVRKIFLGSIPERNEVFGYLFDKRIRGKGFFVDKAIIPRERSTCKIKKVEENQDHCVYK